MPESSVNFVGALALYQQRRDSAIGLDHITARQRGLIWYYNEIDKRKRLEAFHYGIVQGARKRIRQIKKQVTADTDHALAQRLYSEAIMLQKLIENSQKVING